jgi:peptidoglycan/LPS O-acetylase OafA/YrhL
MVFMSHNVIDSTVPFIQHFFKEGYVGVEFFFVLSGFILAYNYQKLLVEKKISLKCFYKARFARIYPLHLLTLVVAAVTAKNVVLNFEYLAYLVANLTLLQSFIPLPDFYFAFNAPSWSISDEFAFYMAFPFIVCFATKKVNAFRIILLIAAASILTLTLFVTRDAHQHALFYINPVFRIFDFCLGITLFQFCSRLEESYPRLLNNVIGGG